MELAVWRCNTFSRWLVQSVNVIQKLLLFTRSIDSIRFILSLNGERQRIQLLGWWALQADLSRRLHASPAYFYSLGFLVGTTCSWPLFNLSGTSGPKNNWISLSLPTKTHEARYEEGNCGHLVVYFSSLMTPLACKDTYVPSGLKKLFSRFLELSICEQGQLRY